MAKPVGPQELWPTPATPSASQAARRRATRGAGEAPALGRREMVADQPLHLGDAARRTPEASSLAAAPAGCASGSSRQDAPRSARGKGGRRRKASASSAPWMPSAASSRTSTNRHCRRYCQARDRSAEGRRLGPRPPSRIRPPFEKGGEADAGAVAAVQGRRGRVRVEASPCSRARPAATASASWVPEPKPAWAGIAERSTSRPRAGTPRKRRGRLRHRQRRRSGSMPSTSSPRRVATGRARPQAGRSPRRGCRNGARAPPSRSRKPKCSRAGARTRTEVAAMPALILTPNVFLLRQAGARCVAGTPVSHDRNRVGNFRTS